MQTRERDQVHGQLPQVSVQLTRETQASSDPGHGGHEVVQVTEGAGGQLLSLSRHLTLSAFSTSWWTDKVQL